MKRGEPFRNGALGALMDEFDRACRELLRILAPLSDAEFEALRDPDTEDDACRSIQTVFQHVVRAGYAHANYLRVAFGVEGSKVEVSLATPEQCDEQISGMIDYMAATLEGRWEMSDEEIEAVRISSGWGTVYDPEQMLEHAIVHVLRHRRQIERFLQEGRYGCYRFSA